MIKDSKSLSLAELKGIISELPESEAHKNLLAFIKRFTKLTHLDAKKLREELQNSEIVKLNDIYITKIIDLLPKDAEDMRKILVDVSLSENETNKILEIVKKYT